MAKRKSKPIKQSRRTFSKEFKQEVVQMLLDGHSASSVSKNLGIGNTNLLYRWKAELVADGGPVAESLDAGQETGTGPIRRVGPTRRTHI